jgi:hypothetical protein
MDTSENLDSAISDLNRTFGMPAYEAFDVAWIAVVKIANLLPGNSEHDRMTELLDRISDDAARSILVQPQVDSLLDLKPPLESIVTSRHERLEARKVADWLEFVRQHRNEDPKTSLRNLGEVLKRVRNRRAHGFKTPEGPRDLEILEPSLWLVRLVGLAAAEALGAK